MCDTLSGATCAAITCRGAIRLRILGHCSAALRRKRRICPALSHLDAPAIPSFLRLGGARIVAPHKCGAYGARFVDAGPRPA